MAIPASPLDPLDSAVAWRSDVRARDRRDHTARRAQLDALAARISPASSAHERVLEVADPFAKLIPRLHRGAVVAIDGPVGAGATSVAFGLAAAATQAGEWVAAVDVDGVLGAQAAFDCGIDPERFVVARNIAAQQWSAVVAALLDGATCVLACVPARVAHGDAQRLIARARERAAALIVVGNWPAAAAWRVRVADQAWPEFGLDAPHLTPTRSITAHVEGRGIAPGQRALALAS